MPDANIIISAPCGAYAITQTDYAQPEHMAQTALEAYGLHVKLCADHQDVARWPAAVKQQAEAALDQHAAAVQSLAGMTARTRGDHRAKSRAVLTLIPTDRHGNLVPESLLELLAYSLARDLLRGLSD